MNIIKLNLYSTMNQIIKELDKKIAGINMELAKIQGMIDKLNSLTAHVALLNSQKDEIVIMREMLSDREDIPVFKLDDIIDNVIGEYGSDSDAIVKPISDSDVVDDYSITEYIDDLGDIRGYKVDPGNEADTSKFTAHNDNDIDGNRDYVNVKKNFSNASNSNIRPLTAKEKKLQVELPNELLSELLKVSKAVLRTPKTKTFKQLLEDNGIIVPFREGKRIAPTRKGAFYFGLGEDQTARFYTMRFAALLKEINVVYDKDFIRPTYVYKSK